MQTTHTFLKKMERGQKNSEHGTMSAVVCSLTFKTIPEFFSTWILNIQQHSEISRAAAYFSTSIPSICQVAH